MPEICKLSCALRIESEWKLVHSNQEIQRHLQLAIK